MDSTVTAGLLGAAATILAAIMGQSGVFDRLKLKAKTKTFR
jgi:hypothetical protein